MNIKPVIPPRSFKVGAAGTITLKDCARIHLDPDEQVTFVLESGGEYDVARKSWGFYATPSLNGRLKQFGLRGVLVRGEDGKYYVWLVQEGKENEFEQYRKAEGHAILLWLDREESIRLLSGLSAELSSTDALQDCLCGQHRWNRIHTYREPPPGETRFECSAKDGYCRELVQCAGCGHYRSIHSMTTDGFYARDYMSATYRDEEGFHRAYERICALDPSKSDNTGRVLRVLRFASELWPGRASPSVLDVGSGLCVFLRRMKEAGWRCFALDPDERAVRHAEQTVGVRAIRGNFMSAALSDRFDLVTFNKVLEHVPDPVTMLARSRNLLNAEGFVYAELPDGEAAISGGFEREEFFIEHDHVFSAASVAHLARRAGFAVKTLERLREPSGKFTIRVFLLP